MCKQSGLADTNDTCIFPSQHHECVPYEVRASGVKFTSSNLRERCPYKHAEEIPRKGLKAKAKKDGEQKGGAKKCALRYSKWDEISDWRLSEIGRAVNNASKVHNNEGTGREALRNNSPPSTAGCPERPIIFGNRGSASDDRDRIGWTGETFSA